MNKKIIHKLSFNVFHFIYTHDRSIRRIEYLCFTRYGCDINGGEKKKKIKFPNTQGWEILDVTLLFRHRDCTVLIANSLLYERQLFMRRLVMTSAPRSWPSIISHRCFPIEQNPLGRRTRVFILPRISNFAYQSAHSAPFIINAPSPPLPIQR